MSPRVAGIATCVGPVGLGLRRELVDVGDLEVHEARRQRRDRQDDGDPEGDEPEDPAVDLRPLAGDRAHQSILSRSVEARVHSDDHRGEQAGRQGVEDRSRDPGGDRVIDGERAPERTVEECVHHAKQQAESEDGDDRSNVAAANEDPRVQRGHAHDDQERRMRSTRVVEVPGGR